MKKTYMTAGGYAIMDVRVAADYATAAIPGAVSVDMELLKPPSSVYALLIS